MNGAMFRVALLLATLTTTVCVTNSDAPGRIVPTAVVTHLPGVSELTWTGGHSTSLAEMKLEALTSQPDANLQFRVEQVEGSLSEHQHGAGFVYVVSGSQQVVTMDRTLDIGVGSASIVAPVAIAHVHKSFEKTSWLFIYLGDVNAPREHGRVVYESASLGRLTTGTHPGGFTFGYTESLRLTELAPGGSSPSHYPIGYEALYVLEGTIEVLSGSDRTDLRTGRGWLVQPRETVRFSNQGTTRARALVFFASPGGEPYQVDLNVP